MFAVEMMDLFVDFFGWYKQCLPTVKQTYTETGLDIVHSSFQAKIVYLHSKDFQKFSH